MKIGSGANTYHWMDGWANTPNLDSARAGWAHRGVVVTGDGDVITFHPGDPTLLVFDRAGKLKHSHDTGLTEAHGITLVKEGGSEYLWIADNGRKRQPGIGYQYPGGGGQYSGQVVKTTLDGRVVTTLAKPDHPVYREGNYSPTFVMVNEERFGGNGDVWVTDGYGESYVHRFDKDGRYLSSLNGEEGQAGRFSCPHAIFIDRRKSQPELYIADRTNGRVQVYDLEGGFKRAFGSDYLTSPSAFVTHGDLLVIAELRARLVLVDSDDRLVCYLGDNQPVCQVEGWPNNKNQAGEIVPTKLLEAGKFNSPHGLAVDSDGNLYVAEWLIGGRFIKLAKS